MPTQKIMELLTLPVSFQLEELEMAGLALGSALTLEAEFWWSEACQTSVWSDCTAFGLTGETVCTGLEIWN